MWIPITKYILENYLLWSSFLPALANSSSDWHICSNSNPWTMEDKQKKREWVGGWMSGWRLVGVWIVYELARYYRYLRTASVAWLLPWQLAEESYTIYEKRPVVQVIKNMFRQQKIERKWKIKNEKKGVAIWKA